MKYTPAQRMQMEAICNPKSTAWLEFGEYIAIFNSTAGVYVKRSDVMIDLSKIFHAKCGEVIDPQKLLKESVMARKEAMGEYYNKYWVIDGEGEKKAYVKDYVMKMFGNGARCRVKDRFSPVLIVKNRNIPIGYVLPFSQKEEWETVEEFNSKLELEKKAWAENSLKLSGQQEGEL